MDKHQYKVFYFESRQYDPISQTASFRYSFDHERFFTERIVFGDVGSNYSSAILERVLLLAHIVIGTSYYKCFPTPRAAFEHDELTRDQLDFCRIVYTEGLSQFIFENDLTVDDMPVFEALECISTEPIDYDGDGVVMLQSGGKDSLLLSQLADEQGVGYQPLYITAGGSYPSVLDEVGGLPIMTVARHLDLESLASAARDGGLNGHVPVTYIVESIALIYTVLTHSHAVLVATATEGNEAHERVGDLEINHQWAKTWRAEQLLTQYLAANISTQLIVGSPIRALTELKVAQLFVDKAWARFGHKFSSCNIANYRQGQQSTQLSWCGECPKCANSYLLFAPFVAPADLDAVFGGKNLMHDPSLTETFKGLLGIDGVMKPFECVGETSELRLAYHMAHDLHPADYVLSFAVPVSDFDIEARSDADSRIEAILKPEVQI